MSSNPIAGGNREEKRSDLLVSVVRAEAIKEERGRGEEHGHYGVAKVEALLQCVDVEHGQPRRAYQRERERESEVKIDEG